MHPPFPFSFPHRKKLEKETRSSEFGLPETLMTPFGWNSSKITSSTKTLESSFINLLFVTWMSYISHPKKNFHTFSFALYFLGFEKNVQGFHKINLTKL